MYKLDRGFTLNKCRSRISQRKLLAINRNSSTILQRRSSKSTNQCYSNHQKRARCSPYLNTSSGVSWETNLAPNWRKSKLRSQLMSNNRRKKRKILNSREQLYWQGTSPRKRKLHYTRCQADRREQYLKTIRTYCNSTQIVLKRNLIQKLLWNPDKSLLKKKDLQSSRVNQVQRAQERKSTDAGEASPSNMKQFLSTYQSQRTC